MATFFLFLFFLLFFYFYTTVSLHTYTHTHTRFLFFYNPDCVSLSDGIRRKGGLYNLLFVSGPTPTDINVCGFLSLFYFNFYFISLFLVVVFSFLI